MGGQVGRQVGLVSRDALVRVYVEELLCPLRDRGLAPETLQECAVRRQQLHALVAPIGDVDVPFGVHRRLGGPVELALALSRLSKSGQKAAVGCELLDAVIAPVGDVNVVSACPELCPRAG